MRRLSQGARLTDFIPYGRHSISAEDLQAVADVLQSSWLTTGPAVERFERHFATTINVPHAVALSSGTAALHAVMHVLDIAPGDEVILPTLTFAATANCILFQGARPVFADVDPHTLLLDLKHVETLITHRTRAVIAMDYAGQACDYAALQALTQRHGLMLVADACHSLGGSLEDELVGGLADLTVFSLHPVKAVAAGEGGVVATRDAQLADRLRRFRNHGISQGPRERAAVMTWEYDISDLGYNYRLSDIHCALANSQLSRLNSFIRRRREIAARYTDAFMHFSWIEPLHLRAGVGHAYHLYVVRIKGDQAEWFRRLHAAGIGVNVHYRPVHLFSWHREHLGTAEGQCPVAEAAYGQILSLPIYFDLSDQDQQRVIDMVHKVGETFV